MPSPNLQKGDSEVSQEEALVVLRQFKEKIADEKFLWQHEDKFLLTFLRTKRYDLSAAYKLLRTYDDFRRRQGPGWAQVRLSTEARGVLQSGLLDVLSARDSRQRRVLWLRAGKWLQREHPAELCLKIGCLLAELCLLEESLHGDDRQMSGLIAIIDLEGLSLAQMRGVTPGFVKRLMHYLVSCLPIRIFTAHIIRESAGFAVIFALFKRFIDDRMKKRIFFHGHDLQSLTGVVENRVLPKELGGPCSEDPQRWIRLLQEPQVRKELQKICYTIMDD